MPLGFIILGLAFVGYYYFFMKGNTSNSQRTSSQLTTFEQNYDNRIEGLDLSQVELLPKPQSKKGIYGVLSILGFGGMLFCLYIIFFVPHIGGIFFLLVVACLSLGFGFYFLSWVNKADEWLLQDFKRTIEINEHVIKEQKQSIDFQVAKKEAVDEARLREIEINNRILHQETEKIDHQITHSLAPEAQKLQVPLTSYVYTRTTDFGTKAELENLRLAKQVEIDAEHQKAINQNKIDKDKAHNILNASERASYPKLKSEYDEKLRASKRELEELKLIPDPSPVQKADIEHLTKVIEETEEEKNALRRNFLQSSNGQEIERTPPAS